MAREHHVDAVELRAARGMDVERKRRVLARLGARLRDALFVKIGHDLAHGRSNRAGKVFARESHHLDGKVARKLQEAVLLLDAFAFVFLRRFGGNELILRLVLVGHGGL